MLTWRLWRALNRPTSLTAVYHRLHVRRGFVEQTRFELPALGLLVALFFMLLPAAFIFFGVPFLFTAFTALLPQAFTVIPLAATVYGLAQCMSVSAQIAHEHEVGIYDTLGACLPGQMGLHWAYASRWLSGHRVLRWLLLALIAVGMFAALLGLSGDLPVPLTNESSFNAARLATTATTILLLWLGYAQTIILSSLIAMLIPGTIRQASNAQLSAAAAFLAVQGGTYAIIYVLNFGLADVLFTQQSEAAPTARIVYSLAILVFTYSIREGTIQFLWSRVVRTLNAKPSELDALTHSGL